MCFMLPLGTTYALEIAPETHESTIDALHVVPVEETINRIALI